MPSINVKIDAKDYQRRLGLAPAMAKMALTKTLRKLPPLVEAESKRRTPVDTGRLRSSIHSEIRPLIATIMPNTNYATFVHEGTSRMKAQPYMKEGLDKAEEKFDGILFKEIDSII